MLSDNTYTHMHTREGNMHFSWLDHAISSSGCHSSISSMTVHYDMTYDDHIPFSLEMRVQNLPKLTIAENNMNSKIK